MLKKHRKKTSKLRRKELSGQVTVLGETTTETILANVIESPPIDGFVPWIVIAVTNGNIGWDFNGYPSDSIVGSYLTDHPESDYAIGIFDTGASSNVISDDDAFKTGIYDNDMVTTLAVELIGATGTVTAYTSDPLGLFIAGIDSLEPNGLLLDDSQLLGEYNVSAIVGDPISSPNLPTVVGAPMAVFLNAAFCNNRQLSVTIDGNDFNSPYIKFYSLYDTSVPSYSNTINLELRPSDASAVQYMPCELLWSCGSEPDGTPLYPSTIWGMLSSQSLYFLPWVNVADGNESINNLEDFMFDTGAQITVISEVVAAGLRLDPCYPDFEVEIQDVTGQTTIEPGFYLDSLEIPATGQWLEYTNVPVVTLNVESPEGGFLDGIIGMNLFVDLNFVFKGGGMSGQGYYPKLQFEPVCRIPGDIGGDCCQCTVDYNDLCVFAESWLATAEPKTDNWNPNADLAPQPVPDKKIDFLDFAVLALHWLQTGP